jgi:hypothetical protein
LPSVAPRQGLSKRAATRLAATRRGALSKRTATRHSRNDTTSRGRCRTGNGPTRRRRSQSRNGPTRRLSARRAAFSCCRFAAFRIDLDHFDTSGGVVTYYYVKNVLYHIKILFTRFPRGHVLIFYRNRRSVRPDSRCPSKNHLRGHIQ